MRFLGVLVLAATLLVSCTDEKSVNAAFFQNKVSWFVFRSASPTGVDPLAGFSQPLGVKWMPADRAVVATDLADSGEGVGVVAVASLGLLLLDDSEGILTFRRPSSEPELTGYRTGRLFVWNRKTFVTLSRTLDLTGPGANVPSVTLAWWGRGNDRLAFYPVVSQARDGRRQATEVDTSALSPDGSGLRVLWKVPADGQWTWQATELNLGTGDEKVLSGLPEVAPQQNAEMFEPLKQRLAARLGAEVSAESARDSEGAHLLLVTASGWAAVGKVGEKDAKLYRLPEIGAAGRYTKALALHHGYVIAWETYNRGYMGASGMVYVPYGVLSL